MAFDVVSTNIWAWFVVAYGLALLGQRTLTPPLHFSVSFALALGMRHLACLERGGAGVAGIGAGREI